MLFDLSRLPGKDAYKLLAATVTPRPIAWISSVNGAGSVNAAPYSFFNVLSGDPPVVAVGIASRPDGGRKDSGANIRRSGEWVVNLVSEGMAEAMNVTAAAFPPEVSEIEQAGLATEPSAFVRPPRIAGAPAALECRLMQWIEIGPERAIVLGRVLAVHVRDEAVLDQARCHVDTPALRLVGRMHGAGWYARMGDLFEMKRIAPEDRRKR